MQCTESGAVQVAGGSDDMRTHSLAAIESANAVLATRTHHLKASVRRKLSTGMRRQGRHACGA